MSSSEYYKTNPIVEKFINELNTYIYEHTKQNFPNLATKFKPVLVNIGKKYIKITHNGSVWGFISRVDGIHMGSPIKKGDLLKPANWRTPARYSRGNIVDGTAKFGPYGPDYLK